MPDYGLGLVQPSMINQQLAQGVQTGIGLGDARVAAMDRQLLLERQAQADAAAKAEREAAIASQQRFAARGKAVAEGGFQPQEVYKLYAENPGVAKHYLDVLGKMNEDTKKNNMRNAAAISAAILKKPEDGAALAEKLADAAANTPGQETEAEALRTLAGQIRDNPGGAALQTSMFLAAAAGDDPPVRRGRDVLGDRSAQRPGQGNLRDFGKRRRVQHRDADRLRWRGQLPDIEMAVVGADRDRAPCRLAHHSGAQDGAS